MNQETQAEKANIESSKRKVFVNCRSVSEFEKISVVGEGTYGIVYSARDKSSGKVVAIKQIKIHEPEMGFPQTSIREINILKHLQQLTPHPNVVNLKEVVVGQKNDSIFLVFEFCDMDLGNVMDIMKRDKQYFSETEIKVIILQVLQGMHYLHRNFIIHRDLKISNLLMTKEGVIKLADFGLSRCYCEKDSYTKGVVTLYYRPPEILMGMAYDQKADSWSLGCIFAEILLCGKPLMPGKNIEHQFELMCSVLGFPQNEDWPEVYHEQLEQITRLSKYNFYTKNKIRDIFSFISEKGQDFISRLLVWDPKVILQNSDSNLVEKNDSGPGDPTPLSIRGSEATATRED